MMRVVRLSLILLGVAIGSWNLSAYRANVRNSEKIDSSFERFVNLAQAKEGSIDDELWGELHRTKVTSSHADGLYNGWNHRIPKVIFGGVLLVTGLLMFRLTPGKKRIVEQVAAPDG